MHNEQILIGAGTAAVCAVGFWQAHWFLQQTRKGQRLVRWFGYAGAVVVLRSLFAMGTLFGVALATDWIHPLQW